MELQSAHRCTRIPRALVEFISRILTTKIPRALVELRGELCGSMSSTSARGTLREGGFHERAGNPNPNPNPKP